MGILKDTDLRVSVTPPYEQPRTFTYTFLPTNLILWIAW